MTDGLKLLLTCGRGCSTLHLSKAVFFGSVISLVKAVSAWEGMVGKVIFAFQELLLFL